MRIGRFVFTPTCINIPLSAHKHLELEIGWGNAWTIFTCSFDWTHRVDHAGPKFTFEVYRLFFFQAKIYDHRHWNHDENRYYLPGEEWQMSSKLLEEISKELSGD